MRYINSHYIRVVALFSNRAVLEVPVFFLLAFTAVTAVAVFSVFAVKAVSAYVKRHTSDMAEVRRNPLYKFCRNA